MEVVFISLSIFIFPFDLGVGWVTTQGGCTWHCSNTGQGAHKKGSHQTTVSCFWNINKSNFLLTSFTQGYLLEPWCLESGWKIILAFSAKDQMIMVFWFLYSTYWHPDKQIELQSKQSLMHHREDIRHTYRVLLMWSIQSIRPWT